MIKIQKIVGATVMASAACLLGACVADKEDNQGSSSPASNASSSSYISSTSNSSAANSTSTVSSHSNSSATIENPVGGDELKEPLAKIDPYPAMISRLSKSEYNNTLRDLKYGSGSEALNKAPLDYGYSQYGNNDGGGRFGNEAKDLPLTVNHLAKYYKASTDLAIEAGAGQFQTIGCEPSAPTCGNEVIENFVPLAWRRPLTVEEKDRLSALYSDTLADAEDPTVALITLVRAVLLSPNFIFRPEIDPDLETDKPRDLNPYELASRLSYFLWASMPDQTLFAKAADGSLTSDAELKAQVQRMLDDPKAKTLITIFANRWFGFDDVVTYRENLQDLSIFPSYTEQLAKDFVEESQHFIEYMLAENRPFSDLANAKYTFLNGSLAEHYGISGYSGDDFKIYQWDSRSPRSGLLGHSSILARAFNGSATNPVKKGFWVLNNLLCDAPPPESVDLLEQYPLIPEELNLNPRQRLETHSNMPQCVVCHIHMDAIGFALEGFDPIGRSRDNYPNGDSVDTASMLASGESFSGAVELGEILAHKPQLAACAISYTMTYALGRNVIRSGFNSNDDETDPDYPALYQIYKNTQNTSHGMRDVITQVVLSPAFRQRRGANSNPAGAQ